MLAFAQFGILAIFDLAYRDIILEPFKPFLCKAVVCYEVQGPVTPSLHDHPPQSTLFCKGFHILGSCIPWRKILIKDNNFTQNDLKSKEFLHLQVYSINLNVRKPV